MKDVGGEDRCMRGDWNFFVTSGFGGSQNAYGEETPRGSSKGKNVGGVSRDSLVVRTMARRVRAENRVR